MTTRRLFVAAGWLMAALASGQGRADTRLPILGDYAQPIIEAAPRSDGVVHLDTPATVARLRALHVTTYFYLVSQPVAWRDLRDEFLPAARAAGIDVYVYTVPPTESRDPGKLPYGHDYVRMAEEIARWSLEFPNLRGLAMDDFGENARFARRDGTVWAEGHGEKRFTPDYVARVRAAARAINPKFKFYALLYWMQIDGEELLAAFHDAIDGVIFAYNDEPTRNTTRLDALPAQLARAERLVSAYGKSLLLMVYCWELVSVPVSPSVDYVRRAVALGLDETRAGRIDGVVTYSLDLGGPGLPYRSWREVKNFAHEGQGRGVIIAASKAPIPAGQDAELATQVPAASPSAGPIPLRFWHRVTYPGQRPPESTWLQVLWDEQVLWESAAADRAVNPAGEWREETVLIPAHLAEAGGELRWRVRVQATIPRSFLTVSFDGLSAPGLALRDPGFETGEGWSRRSRHAALTPLVDVFDPSGRLKMFAAVSELYARERRTAAGR